MKYSTRLADSVHMLVLIALHQPDCSSAGIAQSLATNPAHIRRLMALLKSGGILLTQKGKAEPSLARAASDITLLDLYRIIEKDTPALHLSTHTNPDCREGVHIQYALQEYYDRLQQQFEQEMDTITLQQIIDSCQQRVKDHPDIPDSICIPGAEKQPNESAQNTES